MTYVHEVKMTAPELAPQAEKLMRTVLEQDVEIFNFLRSRRASCPTVIGGDDENEQV